MVASQACDMAIRIGRRGMKPMGTKIMITRDPPKQMSGLITLAEEVPQLNGTVLAVGEMVEEDVRPGDRVSFTKYNATRYELPVSDDDTMEVEMMAPSDIFVLWRPWETVEEGSLRLDQDVVYEIPDFAPGEEAQMEMDFSEPGTIVELPDYRPGEDLFEGLEWMTKSRADRKASLYPETSSSAGGIDYAELYDVKPDEGVDDDPDQPSG